MKQFSVLVFIVLISVAFSAPSRQKERCVVADGNKAEGIIVMEGDKAVCKVKAVEHIGTLVNVKNPTTLITH